MMSDKVYVDTIPLGPGHTVTRSAGFYARPVKGLEGELADRLLEYQTDFRLIQRWLAHVYAEASRRDFVLEVPKEIKEILWPDQQSAAEQSKQATGADSNSASRRRSKQKAASSSTKHTASSSSSQPDEPTSAPTAE